MATTNTRIVIRRDVSTTWSSINPELLTGEQGLETDTGKFKIGEGKTWSATGYATYLPSEVDAKVSDEATIRAGVDNTLQTDLNGAKARIDVLEADPTTATYVDAQVAAEATARTSADDTEAAARAAADTTLQGNIDGEIAARGLAFDALDAAIAINTTAITTEQTARQLSDGLLTAADQELASRLETLEDNSATTAYVDTELALKADVTALADYTTTADLNTALDLKANLAGAVFTGPVTANVTGDLAGNVTGDLTGDSAGTHTGAVLGDVTGNVTGNVVGNADTATVADEAVAVSLVTITNPDTDEPAAAGLFGTSGTEAYISISTSSGGWKRITNA